MGYTVPVFLQRTGPSVRRAGPIAVLIERTGCPRQRRCRADPRSAAERLLVLEHPSGRKTGNTDRFHVARSSNWGRIVPCLPAKLQSCGRIFVPVLTGKRKEAVGSGSDSLFFDLIPDWSRINNRRKRWKRRLSPPTRNIPPGSGHRSHSGSD